MDQKMYLPRKTMRPFNEVYARMCGGEVIQVVPGLSTHLTEGFFYGEIISRRLQTRISGGIVGNLSSKIRKKDILP